MKRRTSSFLFIAVVLLAASMSQASRKEEITLVMVPRDDATVKVGLDLAARYPTLLISYLVKPNGAVSLNGWNGNEWVNISLADFKGGNFYKKGPNSALLISSRASVPSADLLPPDWVDSVFQISTTQRRPLLHLVGQYYDFKYKDWKWFAKRYGYSVDDINPEGLNVAWYDRRLDENLARKNRPEHSDLQYWSIIRYPAPPVEEIEVIASNEAAEPELIIIVEEEVIEYPDEVIPTTIIYEEISVEVIEEEPAGKDADEEFVFPEAAAPVADPFMTEVPEALVLGAGDADEIKEVDVVLP